MNRDTKPYVAEVDRESLAEYMLKSKSLKNEFRLMRLFGRRRRLRGHLAVKNQRRPPGKQQPAPPDEDS